MQTPTFQITTILTAVHRHDLTPNDADRIGRMLQRAVAEFPTSVRWAADALKTGDTDAIHENMIDLAMGVGGLITGDYGYTEDALLGEYERESSETWDAILAGAIATLIAAAND